MHDYYLFLNYSPTHLLQTIYEEALVDANYYLSPVEVLRCDVSNYLRKELAKIFNVPFTDCGFLKTKPQSKYNLHVDVFRVCAINLPLFKSNDNFESKVLVMSEKYKGLTSIEYKTDYFTMLNVTKPHIVTNNSIDKDRITLSIGFKEHSYKKMHDMFVEGKLVNVL